jgi:hypothetical protein
LRKGLVLSLGGLWATLMLDDFRLGAFVEAAGFCCLLLAPLFGFA